jgi:peptidoglycan hydrolase-like protein with peptidoglycan-binding domain
MTQRTLRLTQPMMRGEDVLQLQRRLQSGGWPAPVAALVRSADGLFGPATAAAVAMLQSQLGPPARRHDGCCPLVPPDARRTPPADPLSPAALAALARPHARFGGGTRWSLTSLGIALESGDLRRPRPMRR